MPIIIEEMTVEVVPDQPMPHAESSSTPLPAEESGGVEMLGLIKLHQERKARLDCD